MAAVRSTIVFFRITTIFKSTRTDVIGICTADIKIKFNVIAEVVADADSETGMAADVCNRAAFKLDGL